MKSPLSLLAALAAALLFLPGCDGDDPIDEQELITTLGLRIDNGVASTTYYWRDTDGAGGNAPAIDTLRLLGNATVQLSIVVLDESNPNTPTDITTEINAEREAHQFFFGGDALGSSSLLSIAYNDTDANGRPVGLTNSATIYGAGGPKTLTVKLLHEPNKAAEGVASGNPANAGGETDIEVSFPVVVK